MADPKTSEGARLERKALRTHVRRAIARKWGLERVLKFVLTRQTRYDKKVGGL